MTTSYELGSAVKGATLLTGYETGAIHPGDRFYDAPMKFKGTLRNRGMYPDLVILMIYGLYKYLRMYTCSKQL